MPIAVNILTIGNESPVLGEDDKLPFELFAFPLEVKLPFEVMVVACFEVVTVVLVIPIGKEVDVVVATNVDVLVDCRSSDEIIVVVKVVEVMVV